MKRITNMARSIPELIRYRKVKRYTPQTLETPARQLNVVSAWKGNELLIRDIINTFEVGTGHCLEFGVGFGFSTVALSSYFETVTGVDLFVGDVHTVNRQDHYESTKSVLAAFENIEIVRADYKDWIREDSSFYDLIHVDIVHTYEDTFRCGLWSAEHSKCTLFHDTESFPDVKEAVLEISRKTGKSFYNFKENFGLGIVV